MMSLATIDLDKVLVLASKHRAPANEVAWQWLKSRFSPPADAFQETGLGRWVG